MDIRLRDAPPTTEEREAVDALLGAPVSAWEGAARGSAFDAHVSYVGGAASRARRHLLLPALQALQLRAGWISEGGLNYACERLNVPPADAWGVATFYGLLATAPRPKRVLHVCDDIGCRLRGARELCAALEKSHGAAIDHQPAGDHVELPDQAWMKSPCLGMCDVAPAALMVEAAEEPLELLRGDVTHAHAALMLAGKYEMLPLAPLRTTPTVGRPLLLQRIAKGTDPESLEAYTGESGFLALRKALEIGPPAVRAEVTAAKLLGRGGAAFPTGRKWDAVASQPETTRYLICNADESEPGTFKDRELLANDPFAVIEGMTIAAFATGCTHGFLYLRGEYPLASLRMSSALRQARAANLLGNDILGHGWSFDIELRRGSGAYICGEETAIFNSIEGYRGEPRNKPPFPFQAGLFGKPTLVNNVETLANVMPILLMGGAEYAKLGTPDSTGTRLFCLSGTVQRPGVYEVECGTSLRALIEMAGGVPEGRTLEAVLLGGAAGAFIRGDEIDIPLSFEGARAAKATLGSGVIMLFDDRASVTDAVLRIAGFFRDESCGQCVPCRVGTVRQEESLHRLARGVPRGGVQAEVALLNDVGLAMRDASICGLGQTAYSAVETAIHRLGLFHEAHS
ncbi:MAG: Respiratory-chain dehydrogenase domain 51 kDa subunit [Gemmatimonadetes bacterium]|nr:Respiratory-chain dehydrogenase domain 51 kDa subunit [Gemmatimonadota bacterium]